MLLGIVHSPVGSKNKGTGTSTAPVVVAGGDFLPTPDRDEAAAEYFYLGWADVNGGWLVRRIARADATRADATASDNSSYTTLAEAWPHRATLTYA